jgi:signal transduction histidine kinase
MLLTSALSKRLPDVDKPTSRIPPIRTSLMEHALLIASLGAAVLLTFAHSVISSAFPLLSGVSLGSQEVQIVLMLGLALTIAIMAIASLIALRVGVNRKTRGIQTQLNEQIAQRERAEAANAAKAEFLASMSHGIEAPINAIINFSELALKTELKADSREYLETVRGSAEWLMQMMNDVLEFSRIEAGRLQLHSAHFSFVECIRSTLKIAEPKAVAKGLTLRSKIDPRIPPAVCGDFTRFRQVILNLVDNAVKFTSSGSVMLSAALESESPEAVLVRIAVADTGIGISSEKQQFIFEPFRPLEAGAGRMSGGTGLGLAISRKLVNLMGGEIEFQSQLGAGSTFKFTAWFQKQQTAAESDAAVSAPVPDIADKRSLVQVGKVQKIEVVSTEESPHKKLSPAVSQADIPAIKANSVTEDRSAETNSSDDAFANELPGVAAPISDTKAVTLGGAADADLPDHVEAASDATGTPLSPIDTSASSADALNEDAIDTSSSRPEQGAPDAFEDEPLDAAELATFLQSAGIWKTGASKPLALSVKVADAEIESPCGELTELASDTAPLSVPAGLALLTSACQGGNARVTKHDEQPVPIPSWDPFEQARIWLSKSRFDIRVIHSDGDPTDRNLI